MTRSANDNHPGVALSDIIRYEATEVALHDARRIMLAMCADGYTRTLHAQALEGIWRWAVFGSENPDVARAAIMDWDNRILATRDQMVRIEVVQ